MGRAPKAGMTGIPCQTLVSKGNVALPLGSLGSQCYAAVYAIVENQEPCTVATS